MGLQPSRAGRTDWRTPSASPGHREPRRSPGVGAATAGRQEPRGRRVWRSCVSSARVPYTPLPAEGQGASDGRPAHLPCAALTWGKALCSEGAPRPAGRAVEGSLPWCGCGELRVRGYSLLGFWRNRWRQEGPSQEGQSEPASGSALNASGSLGMCLHSPEPPSPYCTDGRTAGVRPHPPAPRLLHQQSTPSSLFPPSHPPSLPPEGVVRVHLHTSGSAPTGSGPPWVPPGPALARRPLTCSATCASGDPEFDSFPPFLPYTGVVGTAPACLPTPRGLLGPHSARP